MKIDFAGTQAFTGIAEMGGFTEAAQIRSRKQPVPSFS